MEIESQLIEVTVNGEVKKVPSGRTVASLLDVFQIASDRVAVELNKTIVRKRDWDQTLISSGSQIEIVEFVGGG